MLPSIHKSMPHLNRESFNSNPTLTKNLHKPKYSKKLWEDTKPAETNQEIYDSCYRKIVDIEKRLHNQQLEYKFDDDNLHETMKTYSFHIVRLKDAIGLYELKSAKTISDVIKIVDHYYQIEMTNKAIIIKAQRLERSRQARMKFKEVINETISNLSSKEKYVQKEEIPKNDKNTITTIESSDDYTEVEVKNKKNKKNKKGVDEVVNPPHKFNFSTSLNYVLNKRRPLTPHDLINSDPIITPLLVKIKDTRLRITEEIINDCRILDTLFESTMTATRERFPIIMEDIENLCGLYEKYFQSFLENNLDELIETHENQMKTKNREIIDYKYLMQTKTLMNSAFSYNDKIKEYTKRIYSSLRNLRKLNKKFDDQTINGISIKEFSEKSQKVSARYDCDLVPIILIKYEHIIQLEACIELLKEWLDYDKSYSSLLLADLKEVDKQKKNLNSVKYNCECKYNQLNFKFNTLKSNIEVIGKEISEHFKKKSHKLNSYDDDTEFLLNSKREFHLKYFKYQDLDCNQLLEATDRDLNHLERELSNFRANILGTTKSKESLTQTKEKFEHINNLKLKLERLEYETIHLYNQKKIKPNELDLYENCYFKLKEIHMYKNCPQTLNKIFYNLELPSIKFGLPNHSFDQLIRKNHDRSSSPVIMGNTKTDNFFKCLEIISNMIENDWMKLYYKLPFYPERGMENIKKDIEDVYSKLYRGDVLKKRSLCALKKWKRFHSRARIDDLRSALASINRQDILKEIEHILNAAHEHKERKKLSLIQIDPKKLEADRLHEMLIKFFDKNKEESKSQKKNIRVY